MKNNTEKIEKFLRLVDKDFPVPLSCKQDLSQLARKLCEKGTLCAREENGEIVALVAGYTDNLENNIAYISVVATRKDARGKGYARALVCEFIDICREKGIDAVHLYTVHSNTSAVKMYNSIGFMEWVVEDEPRKNDLHLIYCLGEK
ncbi:MAG: GNAT family N-acetyltransferase [Clostridia bacterium]|nr:GNAT family N-acetyltransferase [Clostridia bacterium]